MTSEFTIAVHCMVYLHHHPGKVYSSEALAENVCTNAARIRKVMAQIKKAGFVVTKEGVVGGYQAPEKSGEITLAAIADAIGAVFVSAPWKSGNPQMQCLIASGMADVLSEVYDELDTLCRQRLEAMTLADIDRRITRK